MSTPGPGWLDEPEHDDPVELAQVLAEWAAGNPRPTPAGKTDQEAGR